MYCLFYQIPQSPHFLFFLTKYFFFLCPRQRFQHQTMDDELEQERALDEYAGPSSYGEPPGDFDVPAPIVCTFKGKAHENAAKTIVGKLEDDHMLQKPVTPVLPDNVLQALAAQHEDAPVGAGSTASSRTSSISSTGSDWMQVNPTRPSSPPVGTTTTMDTPSTSSSSSSSPLPPPPAPLMADEVKSSHEAHPEPTVVPPSRGQTFMVLVDGSRPSTAAFHRALKLIRDEDTLWIVHVVEVHNGTLVHPQLSSALFSWIILMLLFCLSLYVFVVLVCFGSNIFTLRQCLPGDY